MFCFVICLRIREERTSTTGPNERTNDRERERRRSSFHSTIVWCKEEEKGGEATGMFKLPWRHEEKWERCCRVDPSDPSSAYRAVESLHGLQDQLDEKIETLADVPQRCAERYPTKQTLGTRKILAIEQEKQSNGKVFKKVSSSRLLSSRLVHLHRCSSRS